MIGFMTIMNQQPTIRSSHSTAQRCHTDAVSSILAYLDRVDFAAAIRSCRSWHDAGDRHTAWPTIDIDRLIDSLQHPSFSRSGSVLCNSARVFHPVSGHASASVNSFAGIWHHTRAVSFELPSTVRRRVFMHAEYVAAVRQAADALSCTLSGGAHPPHRIQALSFSLMPFADGPESAPPLRTLIDALAPTLEVFDAGWTSGRDELRQLTNLRVLTVTRLRSSAVLTPLTRLEHLHIDQIAHDDTMAVVRHLSIHHALRSFSCDALTTDQLHQLCGTSDSSAPSSSSASSSSGELKLTHFKTLEMDYDLLLHLLTPGAPAITSLGGVEWKTWYRTSLLSTPYVLSRLRELTSLDLAVDRLDHWTRAGWQDLLSECISLIRLQLQTEQTRSVDYHLDYLLPRWTRLQELVIGFGGPAGMPHHTFQQLAHCRQLRLLEQRMQVRPVWTVDSFQVLAQLPHFERWIVQDEVMKSHEDDAHKRPPLELTMQMLQAISHSNSWRVIHVRSSADKDWYIDQKADNQLTEAIDYTGMLRHFRLHFNQHIYSIGEIVSKKRLSSSRPMCVWRQSDGSVRPSKPSQRTACVIC
jgi:hypothetical protein